MTDRMDYADGLPVLTEKSFDELFEEAQGKKKIVCEKLTEIESEAQICKQCEQHCQATQLKCQQVIDAHEQQISNGTDQSVIQTARTLIQNAKNIVETQANKFLLLIKELDCFLETNLYKDLNNLVSLLVDQVKRWQHELQLKYAELYADEDLHSFAPWCAKTGELIRDVLNTDMPRVQNAVNAADVRGSDVNLQQLDAQFRSLLISFYQRTFVVVSQEGSSKHDPWNIKKGSGIASAPRITLRILGADTLEALGGVLVHACFVNESHINSYYDDDTKCLDTGGLETQGLKIQREKTTKFVRQKSSGVHEAALSVDVHINLKRAKEKRVHEEKYRLVFCTVLNDTKYWTLSLPMVVTTGGIQLCESLASIMWQCFSTDVFALPTKPLPHLPWIRVADMLQSKMRNISSRTLTEDDLAHLRDRLQSSSWTSDLKEIQLNHFCSASLPNSEDDKKEEFSFWKWFLSIYNLVNKHLKEEWKKGLICFLSKETTERKLKTSNDPVQGLFLLRFSDGSLDSTQTKDSVFGKVATSVLVKSQKGHMEVTHVDRIGNDQLSKNSLLHILWMTKNKKGKNIYKYLYPNGDKCEKLMEGNVTKAQVVSGYLGVQNAFIADLEKIDDQLSKLDLGENKTCPTSSIETDSDADDDSQTVSPCVSEAKKLKPSLNNSSVSVSEVPDKDNGLCESGVFTAVNNEFDQLETLKSAKNTPVLRQMLTNPMQEKHSNLHVYETQLKRNINNLHATENMCVDKTSPSDQMNVGNATQFLSTMIDSIDSEGNITNIGTGSVAAAKPSGSTTLDSAVQNQPVLVPGANVSQAATRQNESNPLLLPIDKPDIENNLSYLAEAGIGDSNLKTAEYMITSTRNGPLTDNDQFNVMQLPAAKAFDSDAVLGSYYGDKNMFDKQVTGPGLVDRTAVRSQLFKPFINVNQQAHNKVPPINSYPDSQNLDELNIDQNVMEPAHCNNSEQMHDPEKAADKILVADESDLDANESIVQLFNGDLDEILKTIYSPSNVPMQTETSPETTNVTMEQSEALLSDDTIMENVKSYLEYLPREKLIEILPKNLIMELITPLFLTKMECLTPLLENLPKDKKQRVIQALQDEKKK